MKIRYIFLFFITNFYFGYINAQSTYTTNRNPVGLEYNLLFNADDNYTVTQPGSFQFSESTLGRLFDGKLLPVYSNAASIPTQAAPYVVLIEGLPNVHTQQGGWIGWTTRYWGTRHFKIEGYNSHTGSAIGWRTIADYSVLENPDSANEFMAKVSVGGAYTKLRFTFYDTIGTNGRLGISELIFLHPEATTPYENLIGSSPWEVEGDDAIAYNGNVNIGVGVPKSKLDLGTNHSEPSEYPNKITLWSGVENNYFGFGVSTSDLDYFSQNNHRFHTEYNGTPGSEKMVIRGDGNVGIGTTNPDMKLSVQAGDELVSRFHSTDTETAMTGIRLGRNVSYADLVNLNDGFGIGVGSSGVNLPLNTQNTSDVAIYANRNTSNVGIGTVTPGDWKLAVNGEIRAKEIKVETGWSDFVFEKEYNLPTLEEVEEHIHKKGHLKDIPSAADVEENGIFLGEMDSKLLQKIEELMLYTIEQSKQIESLKEKVISLEKKVENR